MCRVCVHRLEKAGAHREEDGWFLLSEGDLDNCVGPVYAKVEPDCVHVQDPVGCAWIILGGEQMDRLIERFQEVRRAG